MGRFSYKVEIKQPIFTQLFALHDTRHHIVIYISEVVKYSTIVINHCGWDLISIFHFAQLYQSRKYASHDDWGSIRQVSNIQLLGPIFPNYFAGHLFPQSPDRHPQLRRNLCQSIWSLLEIHQRDDQCQRTRHSSCQVAAMARLGKVGWKLYQWSPDWVTPLI